MSWSSVFSARLRGLFRKDRREGDLEDEVRFHLEMQAEDNLQHGMDPAEARYAALRSFGSIGSIKEKYRERQAFASVEELLREIRYAIRTLRKSPVFAVTGILTLALGIGANTAIFGVVDSVLLRPLPFSEPERLVRIYSTRNNDLSDTGRGGPSPLDLQDFAQQNHTFEKMTVYDVWRKNVSGILGSSAPEQMRVGLASRDLFDVLGIQPLMGRMFTVGENVYGKHYVAAIGYNLWKTRFGGSSSILGQKILINDEPYTVVAVMPDAIPDWMEYPRVDLWTPFAPSTGIFSEALRGARDYAAIARLKPGVSLAQAQADLTRIAEVLARVHPIDWGIGIVVRPLSDTRVGRLRPVLLMLMGAVTLILLISCTNLANLLLARGSTRRRELTVRVALGITRAGLIRHLLVEVMVLSVVGGALGLFFAYLGGAFVAGMHPEQLPQLGMISLDRRVLLFTVSASLCTGLLCGVVPAIAMTRIDLLDALKEGGRSGAAGLRSQSFRRAFVIAEVAFSLVLLIAAGLLLQSVVRLQRQTTGFPEDHLLQAHFYLPPARYSSPEKITQLCVRFIERIRAVPGVRDASATTFNPPLDPWAQAIVVEGQPPPDGHVALTSRFGVTDDRYIKTMRIPLIRGRDFNEDDNETREPVALVNQEFVRKYLSDRNPIGVRVHLGQPEDRIVSVPPNPVASGYVTVVGVIGDFRNNGLALPPEPHLIALFRQEPSVNFGFKDIVVRTIVEPQAFVSVLRRELRELDPNLPLAEVQTVEAYISKQTSDQRFVTSLLSLFAALGLTLALIGIYGVVSYLVAQRTQELGVRLALGASPAKLMWLILKDGLRLAVTGVALGLLGAFASGQLLKQLIFGLSPVDTITFAAASIMLVVLATIASAVPGTRAMRIHPSTAIRGH